MSERRVLGVDGCRAGWVGVVLGLEPTSVQVVFGATIEELVASVGEMPLAAIGIDMPVHPADDEIRPCDIQARRHLGGRKQSSVFITPVWPALRASTYEEAVEHSRRATGKGISRQAWALRPKILEVDAWAPTAPCPIYEVHPEVSFSLMTGSPIPDKKSTREGSAARRAALAAQGITIPGDTDISTADPSREPRRDDVLDITRITATSGPDGQTRPDEARRQAKPDDILDATACAWSARRIAAGTAITFPDPPVALPNGQLQAIWA